MIRDICAFNYSERWTFRDSEEWFFESHAEMMKIVPHLCKYCTYRSIRLPENQFIPANPQFVRIEELWWPSQELREIGWASEEMKRVEEDLLGPGNEHRLSQVKRAVVEREVNILHPELSRVPEITMNELDGKPHIKSLWCFDYLEGLDVEETDRWYMNHHTLVAARNFNLIRYVTYSPAEELGNDQRFTRFTELCWSDWQSMLNDMQSPRGQEVMDDNKNEDGVWRSVNKTRFMDHPHVMGHQAVFI